MGLFQSISGSSDNLYYTFRISISLKLNVINQSETNSLKKFDVIVFYFEPNRSMLRILETTCELWDVMTK